MDVRGRITTGPAATQLWSELSRRHHWDWRFLRLVGMVFALTVAVVSFDMRPAGQFAGFVDRPSTPAFATLMITAPPLSHA